MAVRLNPTYLSQNQYDVQSIHLSENELLVSRRFGQDRVENGNPVHFGYDARRAGHRLAFASASDGCRRLAVISDNNWADMAAARTVASQKPGRKLLMNDITV